MKDKGRNVRSMVWIKRMKSEKGRKEGEEGCEEKVWMGVGVG